MASAATVYLRDKKASRFDFLLGILPNNEITGRVLITGEILLNLLSHSCVPVVAL